MRIGIPKEILNNENRVAITPAGVSILTEHNHQIVIEKDAGLNAGFLNKDYEAAGAEVVETAAEAWAVDMVLKVKEPQPEEYQFFKEELIIFTYLHLAAFPELTKELADKKIVSIAYETVQLDHGTLPLLTPMSEIAGRMAAQIGAQFLEKTYGGKGVLLGSVPGVKHGKVAIIGGGVVGTNAAKIAVGLGADVTIIDLSSDRLRQLDDIFGSNLNTLISNPYNIAGAVAEADLVIGAVLIPGAKAPRLVTKEMIQSMEPGSVVIDVAIDQGGIVETADRVSTHDHPTYEKYGVIHYAVANMPGAVPRTSTIALTNATMPYALEIANKGYEQASLDNPAIRKGLNTLKGSIVYQAIAEAHNMPYQPVDRLLKSKK
ncbi:alanine dehydrogenase [Pueribacillus theae]|uniref:Alanine dehydrogenase n=1 Tax=Pueribacillus theae TaxID=2171751 RepID=A0A2U1K1U2_9BACI|nr:alanine dehydrogenase [Pueribacillus theae]PWA11129.1 alanine dehydrogenase [Pueribacillus theae]